MKKIIFLTLGVVLLNSCVVRTATKVVTGVAKVGYKAVKGTVNGIGWANDQNPESVFTSACTDGSDQMIFKAKKSKFKPVHCSSEKEDWVKYSMKFGKNPLTGEKENYIEYNSNSYISVIDITNKTMVLEGNLMPKLAFSGAKLYLLEKVK